MPKGLEMNDTKELAKSVVDNWKKLIEWLEQQ
jgi:hypothetical protein